MHAYLQRILTWADAHVPGLRATMQPGASSDAIREIEEAIGAELPADVIELYRIHDGQGPMQEALGLIYGFPLLSLRDALGEWSFWQDLLERDPGLQDSCADLMSSLPPGAIEPCYINRGWFPLTSDGRSNYIGVDLAPGKEGTRGQLILFGRDENEKLLLSTSLADFLGWYAGELERGNFLVTIDEDEDVDPVVEAFSIKTPKLHFHDAARELRRTRGPFVA